MADSTAYAKYGGLGGGGGGVTSLNLLTGALTLVGAGGITITPSGSNITITGTGGTVTAVSVATANGFAGTSSGGTTPALTLTTTVTGILQGNGTAISAATTGNLTDAGTDGITVTGGTGAVLGSGTSISQHVADTTHNGYLASADWNTFNSKQPALSITNLTDAGTDGITITNGTGAVIGASPVTISQHVASATNNGYLASTDWSTFNGKQAAGNYITALTGDGTASGPGSAALTLATVNTNTGSFGSSTAIPTFTVNGKGLITAASTAVVVAPAGTLSGTTLNSTVVSSSLTSVGTIATGTWAGTTVAVAHGGTGVTSVTTTPTATAFAGWDANSNLSAANLIDGYATTATAAATTTLVVGSKYQQYFTGTTTQTVTMPVASTLVLGQQYSITNLSTGVVTVQSSGANTIQAMAANSQQSDKGLTSIQGSESQA